MNQEERLKDNLLAAFTDELLAGQLEATGERPPLADVVETLNRVLAPPSPPDSLRRRLREQIAAEWARSPVTSHKYPLNLFARPTGHWRWIVALLAIAFLATLLLPSNAVPIGGTAVGGSRIIIALIVLAAAVALVLAWRTTRR